MGISAVSGTDIVLTCGSRYNLWLLEWLCFCQLSWVEGHPDLWSGISRYLHESVLLDDLGFQSIAKGKIRPSSAGDILLWTEHKSKAKVEEKLILMFYFLEHLSVLSSVLRTLAPGFPR